MKKIVSLLLTIAMILSMSVVLTTVTSAAEAWDGTSVAEGYASGTGTEADPYIIETAAQLKYLADQVNAGAYATDSDADGVNDAPFAIYVELKNDIDLGGKTWTPIGTADHPFYAYFDAKGNTVSNFVSTTDLDYAGFIGVAYGAVKNLTVEKATIRVESVGVNSAAVVVAHALSYQTLNIENCVAGKETSVYVSPVTTKSSTRIGGVLANAGKESVVNVKNCINYADVTLEEIEKNDGTVGGVIGFVRNGSIENCVNYGNLTINKSTKNTWMGGVVGVILATKSFVAKDCINYGNLSGAGKRIGGVTGTVHNDAAADAISLTNMFSLAEKIETSHASGKVGTIVGAAAQAGSFTNVKALACGEIGVVAAADNDGKASAGYDTLANLDSKEAFEAMEEYQAILTVLGLNKSDEVTFSGGTGTEADPYQIANAADLALLSQLVNKGTATNGAYYKVTEDIDLGGEEWTPIGNHWEEYYFNGNFDGNGKTIKNFKITAAQYAVGLFGTACGTIANITLDNAIIDIKGDENGATSAGLIVGAAIGGAGSSLTVKNCRTTDTCSISIESCNKGGDARKFKVVSYGGIVGGQEYTDDVTGIPLTIQECVNAADIVVSCKNVASNNNGVGGIIGLGRELTIDQCANYGDITITYSGAQQIYTGGILGRYQGGGCTMSNVITAGAVIGHQRTGAFVGVVNGHDFALSEAYSLTDTVKKYDPEFEAGKCNPIFGGAPNKKNVTMKNVFLLDNGNPLYTIEDDKPKPTPGTVASYLEEVLRAEKAGELIIYNTKAEVEALDGYKTILTDLGLNKPVEPENPGQGGGLTPATGDNTIVYIVVLLSVVMLAATTVVIVKKKVRG